MITSHSAVEIFGALILIYVGALLFRTYRHELSAATITLIGGLVICGISDIFHAIEAAKHHELIPIWVPWSWGVSRMVLGTMLMTTALFALIKPAPCMGYIAIVIAALSSVVLNTLPIIYPEFIKNLNFVQHTGIITRPMDAILFVGWALMTAFMWRGGEAKLVFPRGFRWFMSLGALSHFVMAFFSDKALDPAFMIAHVIKLVEYWVWAYFATKDFGRHEKVGHNVYIAERVGENMAEHDEISRNMAELLEAREGVSDNGN